MSKVQFSMAGLMGLIFVLAVGFAALKSANKLWVGIVSTLVLGTLLFAVLGIAHSVGATRRFWSGFAVFGWGYLVFIYAPWFASNVRPFIPSTDLVRLLHNKLATVGEPVMDLEQIAIWVKSDGGYWIDGQDVADESELTAAFPKVEAGKPSATRLTFYFEEDRIKQTMLTERNRLTSLLTPRRHSGVAPLPLRPTFEDFSRVGHALIALLAGFTGGFLARILLGRPADASRHETGESAPKTGTI